MPEASAVRTPMIALEMDRQEKALEHLTQLISTLSDRLNPILRPDAPSPPVQASEKGQSMVALAGGLSEANGRIERACERLQSIFDRIEL